MVQYLLMVMLFTWYSWESTFESIVILPFCLISPKRFAEIPTVPFVRKETETQIS